MALKGTLKDFGIAEIFQLIGNQTKSGVLHLKSKDDEIHIFFHDGNVVRAESQRKTKEKLGAMLVRAEVIKEAQLDRALEEQKRTLRRLGDILVEHGSVTKETLREMTGLQTSETVYKLFRWKSGTYEFEPGSVEYDKETVAPIRSESVLMEGFRQVDEWPVVRKKITSAAMTFERLKELAPSAGPKTVEDEVDDAFGEFEDGKKDDDEPEESQGEFANLGKNERRVYDLATAGRTVEKIIDLARFGEFETCKALLNLVNLGVLKAVPPPKRSAASEVGAFARDWKESLSQAVARVGVTLLIAGTLAGLVFYVNSGGLSFAAGSGGRTFRDNSVERFLARPQMARLSGALDVYRLEKGEFPAKLDELVAAGLASPRDLEYPFSEPYYYRRKPEGGFILLPPVE